jgi:hypothetical protein
MNYKKWLYLEEIKDLKYYQNLILSKIGPDNQNLNQSLNTVDPERFINKLSELGEYKSLNQEKRKRIENQIRSKLGTINDIAKLMI